MSDTFQRGDVLEVMPADNDECPDPEAIKHRGQFCHFMRYSPTGYACVEFITEPPTLGRMIPFFFRPKDLRPKARVTA